MSVREAEIQVIKEALENQGISRPCNYIDGSVERLDGCFSYLTQLCFFNKQEFKYLFQQLSGFLKKPSNEMGWALRGYFSYLKEDYKDAAASFLEAIVLAPENLDNWLDYAFALRHIGFDDASLKILFNTKAMIKLASKGTAGTRKMRLIKSLKI